MMEWLARSLPNGLQPDLNKPQALSARRAILDRATGEQNLLHACHNPMPAIGRVSKNPGRNVPVGADRVVEANRRPLPNPSPTRGEGF